MTYYKLYIRVYIYIHIICWLVKSTPQITHFAFEFAPERTCSNAWLCRWDWKFDDGEAKRNCKSSYHIWKLKHTFHIYIYRIWDFVRQIVLDFTSNHHLSVKTLEPNERVIFRQHRAAHHSAPDWKSDWKIYPIAGWLTWSSHLTGSH